MRNLLPFCYEVCEFFVVAVLKDKPVLILTRSDELLGAPSMTYIKTPKEQPCDHFIMKVLTSSDRLRMMTVSLMFLLGIAQEGTLW